MLSCRRSPIAVPTLFGILGAMLSLPGCSGSKELPLVPVSGTLKLEGKPLPVGWITYYADEAKGNTLALIPLAEIHKDGRYELTTNGKPGAPPGFWKVVVAATLDPIPIRPPPPVNGKPWQPNWLTHDKYTKPETTDLRVEVIENPAAGRYDFDLSR